MYSSHRILHEYLNSYNKLDYFQKLELRKQQQLLLQLNDFEKKEILRKLNFDLIFETIKGLDNDEITDIIQVIPPKLRHKITHKFEKYQKEHIEYLLGFSPHSAGGLMSHNYIEISLEDNKHEIIQKLEKHLHKFKKEPILLVVNNLSRLIGELKLSTLLKYTTKEELYSKITKIPTISSNASHREIVQKFKEHKHEKVVVLDEQEYIIGIINAERMFPILEEKETEMFLGFVNLNKEETAEDPGFKKFKFRISWLFMSLISGLLSALVVQYYEGTLKNFLVLASFMPLIANLGGSSGNQTIALLIRGLATKHENLNLRKIFFSEIVSALLIGAVLGSTIAVIATFFDSTPYLGLVVGISLLGNILIASIIGSVLPLLVKHFGLDPAVSSSPTLTVITDFCGFFLLLGLATAVLL